MSPRSRRRPIATACARCASPARSRWRRASPRSRKCSSRYRSPERRQAMSVGGWIFLVVAIGLVVWAVSVFNGLVARRNRFRNAFAQIDVQLKRRHDLIPNLVETAKGYMKHEREPLEAVVAARNAAAT